MNLKNQIISLLTRENIKYNVNLKFPLDYIIPVYHSVSNEKIPHLEHIISYKNINNFEKDLDFLAKNFQFVNWDEFKEFVNGNLKPKKKIALLTFDDGLREFKTIIAPILLRKGIFAINFVNPEFIDNQKMMFRNQASLLVNAVLNAKEIPDKISQFLKINHINQQKVKDEILKIDFKNKEKLNEIATLFELDFKDYLLKNQPYLNIEEIHKLSDMGFTFGAHSMNHPLYNKLSLDRQLEETKDSLKFLKNNALKPETFAFPFTDYGVSKSFFDQLFTTEKELFCTFGSAGIKKDSFTKNFQRIPMENNKTAELTINEEITYFNIKKWLNKNTITRK